MNIIISSLTLVILFIIYKSTYFFNKKRYKIFQYVLIVFLFSLALIDIVIGNKTLKSTGFSWIVGINYFLAILLSFSGTKVMKEA